MDKSASAQGAQIIGASLGKHRELSTQTRGSTSSTTGGPVVVLLHQTDDSPTSAADYGPTVGLRTTHSARARSRDSPLAREWQAGLRGFASVEYKAYGLQDGAKLQLRKLETSCKNGSAITKNRRKRKKNSRSQGQGWHKL